MSELGKWLPQTVFYGALALSIALMWSSRLLDRNREFVERMGGPVGRWLVRRHEQRDELRQEARRREAKEATPDHRAMQRRQDALYDVIKALEAEIRQRKAVEEANAENWDMTAAYLREDAPWHIRAGVVAAEHGIELPEHRSYSQFCRDYREVNGMKTGRRWTDPPSP